MIIQGILDSSLNGQLCIRGFANIKDLARLSEADYSYQRNLLERTDIIDFLENQDYLFFPEIILSYKFKYKFDDTKVPEPPLVRIQRGERFKSNVKGDNTEISVTTIAPKNPQCNSVRVVELYIDESMNKPFHRIDGNHRLSAAEQLHSEKIERMIVPFCLLLGTEYYDKSGIVEHPETKEFDKAVKVFFHNINAKTIPLTLEENLKVMIDDCDNFDDQELETIFAGKHPILTRKLKNRIPLDILTGIQHILKDNYRTYFNDVFKRLLNDGFTEEDALKKVTESLQAVNQLYSGHPILKDNDSYGLLTAFLWYHIKSVDKYYLFVNWILHNHIFEIKGADADSIITIFDKLIAQDIKVFVAMPYFENNPDIVDEYNTIYSDTIKQIASEYKINISLFPIMRYSGETVEMIQDIINKIKEAKIVFADITGNNPNVLYELGWARALNRKVVIIKEKHSDPVKFDLLNDSRFEYDDKYRSKSLGKIVKDNILHILKDNFGLITEKS